MRKEDARHKEQHMFGNQISCQAQSTYRNAKTPNSDADVIGSTRELLRTVVVVGTSGHPIPCWNLYVWPLAALASMVPEGRYVDLWPRCAMHKETFLSSSSTSDRIEKSKDLLQTCSFAAGALFKKNAGTNGPART